METPLLVLDPFTFSTQIPVFLLFSLLKLGFLLFSLLKLFSLRSIPFNTEGEVGKDTLNSQENYFGEEYI